MLASFISRCPCNPQLKSFYSSIYRRLCELLHLIEASLKVGNSDCFSYLVTDLAELLTGIVKVRMLRFRRREDLRIVLLVPPLLLFLSERQEAIDSHGGGGLIEVHNPAPLRSLEVNRRRDKL